MPFVMVYKSVNVKCKTVPFIPQSAMLFADFLHGLFSVYMNAVFMPVKTLAGIAYLGAKLRKLDPEFWLRLYLITHTVEEQLTK